MPTSVVPIFRIFDYKEAVEFYVDWLGFKIDWEHKFHEQSPLHMQVSRDGIVLHLSEHHGDSTPDSKAYITTDDVRTYDKEIREKKYKFYHPGVEMGTLECPCFEVMDPIGSKLLITEVGKK